MDILPATVYIHYNGANDATRTGLQRVIRDTLDFAILRLISLIFRYSHYHNAARQIYGGAARELDCSASQSQSARINSSPGESATVILLSVT